MFPGATRRTCRTRVAAGHLSAPEERERDREERETDGQTYIVFGVFVLCQIVESMSAFVHEKQLVRDTKVFLLLINVYLCHVSAAAVYQALNVEKT